MRLPVLGGMTQAEGTALGAFATSGAQAGRFAPSVNLGSHGTLLQDGAQPAQSALYHVHCVVLNRYLPVSASTCMGRACRTVRSYCLSDVQICCVLPAIR